MPDLDTEQLAKEGTAEVRSINFAKLGQISDGIFHNKMMVVDNAHVYIGSANAGDFFFSPFLFYNQIGEH